MKHISSFNDFVNESSQNNVDEGIVSATGKILKKLFGSSDKKKAVKKISDLNDEELKKLFDIEKEKKEKESLHVDAKEIEQEMKRRKLIK